jgi:hypothetical protein
MSGDTKREANQLRLTCRQLYAETTGLGIRYNDITFIDTTKRGRVSAYQHFTRFIEIISRAQLRKVKRVNILDGQTFHNTHTNTRHELLRKCCHTSPVLKVCQNLPNLVVVVRIRSEKSMTGQSYVQDMDYLRQARERSVYLYGNIDDVNDLANPEGSYTFPHPPNLRFSHTFEFQEDAVRSMLGGHFSGKRLEDLVDKVRREHDDGI